MLLKKAAFGPPFLLTRRLQASAGTPFCESDRSV
jgi:hypothetical protein